MRENPKQNVALLKELIEKIQEIESIGIGQICLLAGNKDPNYLSVQMSKGDVSPKLIKKVRNVYERAKKDPATLSTPVMPPIIIKDPAQDIIKRLIWIEAKIDILFRNDAERKSERTGQPSLEVLQEMNTAARHVADSSNHVSQQGGEKE